ncbi:ribonuclease PH [Candidatus Synchoanobacter obligatus]|uniref:Ribonuclease PH n=1 Tax=Candidatus Synchoanobacter obligatus TaxID=2919597 RepID=A0ABT1L590_9GAMM|nr:ribonuclease PH [Candidatus Synchoanobacter obligatus]MCP8352344.1 ribonuclease PH [Candidatus Synchoanobacter obligatus]
MNARSLKIIEHPTRWGEGNIEIQAENTCILCTSSVIDSVPRFLRDSNQAWLTAEYNMLPRATHTRTDRDIQRGKISPRSSEIQRLIGRSLRTSINLKAFSGHTIIIDCDVLQADGSTRCHAINGGQIALIRGIQKLQHDNKIKSDPVNFLVGAISAGIVKGKPFIDLDYNQDHKAEVDLNIIMNEHGDLIEIQGTAEKKPFSRTTLNELLDLAWPEIERIIQQQKAVLQTPYPYNH